MSCCSCPSWLKLNSCWFVSRPFSASSHLNKSQHPFQTQWYILLNLRHIRSSFWLFLFHSIPQTQGTCVSPRALTEHHCSVSVTVWLQLLFVHIFNFSFKSTNRIAGTCRLLTILLKCRLQLGFLEIASVFSPLRTVPELHARIEWGGKFLLIECSMIYCPFEKFKCFYNNKA